MVILNLFPKATFSSPSLSSLPTAHSSSFNWGGVTGTDLWEGAKMYVGAVVGFGMQHS